MSRRPGDVAGDQLRAIVERIERIEEEIKELAEGKKEVYLEAKGNGFDVKILREVIRVRKQDQKERDEQESLLDVYLQAIQGAAPAFDMTIARDRTIGIIFGNLVVAVVFTQIWPVTIVERIDPAIASLLRQVAALVAAASTLKRWGFAAEARAKLTSVEQDLDLTRYEPSSLRPGHAWLDARRRVVRILSSLQGPLLIGADQGSGGSEDTMRRLERLAACLGEPGGAATAAQAGPGRPEPKPAPPSAIAATVESSLAELEQIIADISEHTEPGTTDHALA